MQFNEFYSQRTGLTVGVEKVLFSETSPYQKVEVLETDTWGKMMTIDGLVMLSEKDEFVYHEMLTHVAMFAHPYPQRVLIIGGGDGGTAREVLRHPSVKHVDMVEIDETVVQAAKRFLPEVGDFDNPKLNVLFEDGVKFVEKISDPYDIVIIDGSDPVGPAEDLFSERFYRHCYDALSSQGILTTQTESPWVASYHHTIKNLFSLLDGIFEVSNMYLAFIPLYPAGMWSMAFASRGIRPHDPEVMKRVIKGTREMKGTLRYYNPEIHRGAFALPGFVQKILD
ncbi:MAG: polyamine aminopropyltransferase [Balneolales bacterium]